MRLRFKHFILLLLLILVSFAPAIAAADKVPPQPPNYVVDLASIIDSNAEASLNAYLKELELKTSAQMVVLTIASLDGASIEEFSINLAHDQWKLGQKGKDNGLLLLVSMQDRNTGLRLVTDWRGYYPTAWSAPSVGNIWLPILKKATTPPVFSLRPLRS